jgi:hypothetical protein
LEQMSVRMDGTVAPVVHEFPQAQVTTASGYQVG